jgi:hypothetical protein
MALYSTNVQGQIVRDDGAIIPQDLANCDYRDALMQLSGLTTGQPSPPIPVYVAPAVVPTTVMVFPQGTIAIQGGKLIPVPQNPTTVVIG